MFVFIIGQRNTIAVVVTLLVLVAFTVINTLTNQQTPLGKKLTTSFPYYGHRACLLYVIVCVSLCRRKQVVIGLQYD